MNDISADTALLYIAGIVAVILIFLALRSVVLWYFKIDTIVKNQEETQIILKDILNELQKNNKKDSRYFDIV